MKHWKPYSNLNFLSRSTTRYQSLVSFLKKNDANLIYETVLIFSSPWPFALHQRNRVYPKQQIENDFLEVSLQSFRLKTLSIIKPKNFQKKRISAGNEKIDKMEYTVII